jgi:hypothetical protein
MLVVLASTAVALSPYFADVSLGGHESRTISLTEYDVFFINTFGLTPDVEFDPTPASLIAGDGYAFRGESLTLRSHTDRNQHLSLWFVPKGACLLNNFILYPLHFAITFTADLFSQFCLFSPLNMTEAVFAYGTDTRPGTIAVVEGTVSREASENQAVRTRQPCLLYNTNPARDIGRFQMEVNAVGQVKCEVKPIVEVGAVADPAKWANVKPSCTSLQEPAFSLPLACILTTALAVGIGFAFHRVGWIDVRRLLSPTNGSWAAE